MDQQEVNDAVSAALNNDLGPWMRVGEAIRDGEVTGEGRANSLVLKAVTRPAVRAFGARLTKLRAESGLQIQEISDVLDVSVSAVTRHLHGQAVGAWPVISMMITTMGGDPAEYRADYLVAKDEGR